MINLNSRVKCGLVSIVERWSHCLYNLLSEIELPVQMRVSFGWTGRPYAALLLLVIMLI